MTSRPQSPNDNTESFCLFMVEAYNVLYNHVEPLHNRVNAKFKFICTIEHHEDIDTKIRVDVVHPFSRNLDVKSIHYDLHPGMKPLLGNMIWQKKSSNMLQTYEVKPDTFDLVAIENGQDFRPDDASYISIQFFYEKTMDFHRIEAFMITHTQKSQIYYNILTFIVNTHRIDKWFERLRAKGKPIPEAVPGVWVGSPFETVEVDELEWINLQKKNDLEKEENQQLALATDQLAENKEDTAGNKNDTEGTSEKNVKFLSKEDKKTTSENKEIVDKKEEPAGNKEESSDKNELISKQENSTKKKEGYANKEGASGREERAGNNVEPVVEGKTSEQKESIDKNKISDKKQKIVNKEQKSNNKVRDEKKVLAVNEETVENEKRCVQEITTQIQTSRDMEKSIVNVEESEDENMKEIETKRKKREYAKN